MSREVPVVNFLENEECMLEESEVPNCYRFASNQYFLKSTKIPVVIEGVRVPIMLDTGAEVSVLSTKFVGICSLIVISPRFPVTCVFLGDSWSELRDQLNSKLRFVGSC